MRYYRAPEPAPHPHRDNIIILNLPRLQTHHPLLSPHHQTKMPPQTSILLLKTKSTPQDGYDDFFSANNYLPCFIPVLEHRFHAENLARVRDLFASGAFDSDPRTDNADAHTDHPADNTNPGKKYGGMIFTSQRAVEAFVKMIEEDGRMSCPFLPPSCFALLCFPPIPVYTYLTKSKKDMKT